MKEFFRNLKFVWKYAKGERIKIFLFFILSIVGIGASIIGPFISAKLIINLTDNQLVQFITVGGICVIIYLISDSFEYVRTRLYQKIIKKIHLNIQSNLGAEILKLNNKTLEENGSGIFIQRLVGDTRQISTIFTDSIKYLNDIISNVGILVTFFVLSKIIFLFVIFSFSIRLVLEIIRINRYNKNEKEYRKTNDSITGFTGEIVRGAEDIKMLNGEKSFLKELKDRFEKLNDEKLKMEKQNMNFLAIRWIWAEVSWFILLCLIAWSVAYNGMAIAIGVVIYNFGNRYNRLVEAITGFHELIKRFNLSATRIFEIYTDDKYEKESFGDVHLDKVKGNFEFKNVSFKYDKNNVLNNLSFKVNANETVAFVGKSGAGKTTIFSLLCKMYDNYKGNITIDGVNIKELDKDTIRSNITIVSQNPYIFNMSIKDNLKLVKGNLTTKEMKEACKMACLDDFIESLPKKYNTIVGEGGITLSGGQRQRLAIARAFVQKTEIILLDEATSALDNETQAKIQEAIDNLQKKHTILIIAHRLSTIKNADRILVLNDGKIVAEGKHKDLLKNCKYYKELYDTEITKSS